jgi:hypothetical protein
MTDEQINAAIAEACGWTQINVSHRSGRAPNVEYIGSEFIPNYCNDLNAMHEAEKVLANDEWWLFVEWLTDICGAGVALCISANARQRAEAFLRTLGKWEQAN